MVLLWLLFLVVSVFDPLQARESFCRFPHWIRIVIYLANEQAQCLLARIQKLVSKHSFRHHVQTSILCITSCAFLDSDSP